MVMVTGVGVDPAIATETLARWAPNTLVDGEEVWFYAASRGLQTTSDAVVVTNARVLALSPSNGFVFRALHVEVTSAQFDEASGRIELATRHGASATFKGLRSADVAALRHFLRQAYEQGAHPELLRVLSAMPIQASRGAPSTPAASVEAAPSLQSQESGEPGHSGAPASSHLSVVPNAPATEPLGPQAPPPGMTEVLSDAAASQTMVPGRKVDVAKADKALTKWSSTLVDGEFVWLYAKCNNLSPMTDAVVVTNARIMGIARSTGYAFMVTHPAITNAAFDAKRGTVHIETASGRNMTFKDMHADDVHAVAFCLDHARAHAAPEPVLAAADAAVEAERRRRNPTAEEKLAAKAEKWDQRQEESVPPPGLAEVLTDAAARKAMVPGHKVDVAKADKTLTKWSSMLVDGEFAWLYAKCNNLSPMTDAVVVTNARIMGILASTGYIFMVTHNAITNAAFDAKRGTVHIETASGRNMTFKAMHADDVHAVAFCLDHARAHAAPEPVLAAADAAVEAERRRRNPTAEEKLAAKVETRNQRQEESKPPPGLAEVLTDAAARKAMVPGHKVDVAKADETLSKWSSTLVDGEFVWLYAKCNNLSPITDAVVVTNARIMGILASTGYVFMASHAQITSRECDPGRGTVDIATTSGWNMTFKAVHGDDVHAVAFCLDRARTHAAPERVLAAADAAVEADRRRRNPTAEEKQAGKVEKRRQREEEKARQTQLRADRAAANLERFGRCVYDGMFGLRTIRIYNKGYVRVSLPMLGSKAPYERLVDIQSSADVGKKSGFGRAVGAAATGGLSLASSNKRGDVYVTISTESRTHVLHEDPPNMFNLKQAKKIEGIGRSVIHQAAARGTGAWQEEAQRSRVSQETPIEVADSMPAVSPPVGNEDLASRLQKLNQLLADGLVSEEEYARLRVRLLDEL